MCPFFVNGALGFSAFLINFNLVHRAPRLFSSEKPENKVL